MSDPLEDILKKAIGGMNFLPKFDAAPVSPHANQVLRLSTIKVHYGPYESNPRQAAFLAEHSGWIKKIGQRIGVDPDSVIDELYDWVFDHPDVPVLRNHLFVALQYAGSEDEAAAVCTESYFRFPKYVFAFTNYILMLDLFDRSREVDELLKHISGVQDIDPTRDEYHVSEVFGFESMMCRYLLIRDKVEEARSHVDVAASLVPPNDPRILQLRADLEDSLPSKSSKKPKAPKGKKKKK